MFGAPTLNDIGTLEGTRVILRMGLNVPLDNVGYVAEPFRVEVLIPTLRRLKELRARVLVIGHIGTDGVGSLRGVHRYLESRVGSIQFIDHLPFDLSVINDGGIVILENIRRYAGEKTNDPKLADIIARSGDVFINEAFSDSHRTHASIVGVATRIPSYIGNWFSREVAELSAVFQPEHPFVCVVGGAKIATKLPLVSRLLESADTLLLAGALANDYWDSRGIEVGRSLISSQADLSAIENDTVLILPSDVLVERDGGVVTIAPDAVKSSDRIVDVGAATLVRLKTSLDRARLVVWNGPLGNTDEGYSDGTLELARLVAGAPGRAIVGGGDTIAAISKLDLFDRFHFVSTGGGAMLDYLANETLPGIEAIRSYWSR
ncbi:MAG: phosphoglycerate kinase [bacterium]|nr:phosphoglycerate kinase [bacterium]